VRQSEDDLRREGLVAVADDGGHTGHARKLMRRALRVAAGDDDFGSGIFAMRAADERTSRAICLSRYAAGVDYDYVGCKGLALGKCTQTAGDGLAVCARGTATEVLDVKAGHRFQFSKFLAAERLAECKAGDIGLERISTEENQCVCQNNSLANFPANSRADSRE
jgi:hypothetical protein